MAALASLCDEHDGMQMICDMCRLTSYPLACAPERVLALAHHQQLSYMISPHREDGGHCNAQQVWYTVTGIEAGDIIHEGMHSVLGHFIHVSCES